MRQRIGICTTSINPPTVALDKFAEYARAHDSKLYIAGDVSTPEDSYREWSPCKEGIAEYLSPGDQIDMDAQLSNAIPWRCIQRRNFAILKAFRDGCDIIALVDDDNIPKDGWGEDLSIGRTVDAIKVETTDVAFDPLFTHESMWHRGYPIQLLEPLSIGDELDTAWSVDSMSPLVQADLWDGEPDVDAICRIANGGSMDVRLGEEAEDRFLDRSPLWNAIGAHTNLRFYCGSAPGPFNSQNTFISRKVLPVYFLFPGIGRMDDIWASYITQAVFPDSVVYSYSSVVQERNSHNLVKDLKEEMLGYEHTYDLIKWLENNDPLTDDFPEWFPKSATEAWSHWWRVLTS